VVVPGQVHRRLFSPPRTRLSDSESRAVQCSQSPEPGPEPTADAVKGWVELLPRVVLSCRS